MSTHHVNDVVEGETLAFDLLQYDARRKRVIGGLAIQLRARKESKS